MPLARRTLSEWIGRLRVALQPLVNRLADKLREQGSLHADETPVQQLDPGKGKTKRAYLWSYCSNDLGGGPPMVVFDYQISRRGKHARDFLADWRGHLPIDNNPVENAIRSIAVGKKNWLFAGSERAGRRAAVIQCLLATAKLNGRAPAA